MRISLIDLGTNSVRLFIFDLLSSGKIREIFRTKEMVRLGDNLFETKKMDPKAYKRTVKAFRSFRTIINEYDVDLVRALATSALREAEDRDRLVDKVLEKTGIPIEVISGTQEAEMIAKGIIKQLHFDQEPLLFVDIGGGSTELSYYIEGKVYGSLSLELGAARCQQLFLKSVPPKKSKKSIQSLREHIKAQLDEHCSGYPKGSYPFAVGSSGSIRALERLYNREKPDREKKIFPGIFAQDFVDQISAYTREQILKIPTIEEKRADLILSATIILDEIIKYFSITDVLATNFALKDGILEDVLGKGTPQQYKHATPVSDRLFPNTDTFSS